ncbi:hypothetical protein ACWCP6_09995 [Streptomyces sp. NPDC002004]
MRNLSARRRCPALVLQLLVGAGLIAVLLVGLVTGTSARGLRAALRALLNPAA